MGVILFLIMVVIRFVVITQGRLESAKWRWLPWTGCRVRQMAIDADLHAGLIDHRRAPPAAGSCVSPGGLLRAMDGASRFVRGDAIAGVVILLVNIFRGLLGNRGMSLGEAVDVFTKLTIGDGLVSQIPAFLISLAAGLIVTRSSSSNDLSHEVTETLFSQPAVLGTAAAFLGFMAALDPAAQAAALDPGWGGSARGAGCWGSAAGGERIRRADFIFGRNECAAGGCRFRPAGSESPRVRFGPGARGTSQPAGAPRWMPAGPDGRSAARGPLEHRDWFPVDRPGRPVARETSSTC